MKNRVSVEIKLLSDVHLPEALWLTEQAQWNQTERDWRRLLQSPPKGCFGAFLDGRLIGTVTTVAYGTELAWIGMMLVDPDYRRRGLGTRLMQAVLEHLQRIGAASIKLDATPAGRPLYESMGFRPEGLVERWEGMGKATGKNKWPAWDERFRPALYGFDRLAFGADRSPNPRLFNSRFPGGAAGRDNPGRATGGLCPGPAGPPGLPYRSGGGAGSRDGPRPFRRDAGTTGR